VDLDDCRIDHGIFHIGIIGNGIEYPFKNIGFDPMAKALEHCVPVAEMRRQIAPWAPGPRDPQNGFNKQPRISSCPARIGLLSQTMRFDFLPLGVRKAEAIHEKLLWGA
jgi:hypothetical protein